MILYCMSDIYGFLGEFEESLSNSLRAWQNIRTSKMRPGNMAGLAG